MKSYFNKLMMYHEIHRMNREGFSDLRISRELVVSRHTVKRYLSMSEDDYNFFLERQSNRKKELHPYEEFVRSKLATYPDTPAAQLHDWLKEFYKPLDLLKLGDWEWGNKLNSNCKYVVVQNKIFYAVMSPDNFDDFS